MPTCSAATKLMHNQKDPKGVLEAIDVSLQKAGLDYVDLYLIHGPEGGPEIRAASWEGCCQAKDLGKAKSIGVRCAILLHAYQVVPGG